MGLAWCRVVWGRVVRWLLPLSKGEGGEGGVMQGPVASTCLPGPALLHEDAVQTHTVRCACAWHCWTASSASELVWRWVSTEQQHLARLFVLTPAAVFVCVTLPLPPPLLLSLLLCAQGADGHACWHQQGPVVPGAQHGAQQRHDSGRGRAAAGGVCPGGYQQRPGVQGGLLQLQGRGRHMWTWTQQRVCAVGVGVHSVCTVSVCECAHRVFQVLVHGAARAAQRCVCAEQAAACRGVVTCLLSAFQQFSTVAWGAAQVSYVLDTEDVMYRLVGGRTGSSKQAAAAAAASVREKRWKRWFEARSATIKQLQEEAQAAQLAAAAAAPPAAAAPEAAAAAAPEAEAPPEAAAAAAGAEVVAEMVDADAAAAAAEAAAAPTEAAAEVAAAAADADEMQVDEPAA